MGIHHLSLGRKKCGWGGDLRTGTENATIRSREQTHWQAILRDELIRGAAIPENEQLEYSEMYSNKKQVKYTVHMVCLWNTV